MLRAIGGHPTAPGQAYVMGVVQYRDQFDLKHESGFKRVWDWRHEEYIPCKDGNWAD